MGLLSSILVKGGISAVLEGVGQVARPFSDAYVASQKTKSDTHRIDAETARDVTIADSQVDLGLAQIQGHLSLADRAMGATRWMRPAGFYASLYFLICYAIQSAQPRLAELLYIEITEPPTLLMGAFVAIVCSVFATRPFEKSRRLDAITTLARTTK